MQHSRVGMDAAPGLISIATGVAVVNRDLVALYDPKAVERCPTGAIVWLTGAQFAGQPSPPVAGPRGARVAPQFMGSTT